VRAAEPWSRANILKSMHEFKRCRPGCQSDFREHLGEGGIIDPEAAEPDPVRIKKNLAKMQR